MITIESAKWELACKCLRAVMAWHRDPESPEYNECEKTQCFWCELAEKAMSTDSLPKEYNDLLRIPQG